MLGSIQGARPEHGFSLGGMQVHAKEQGLEQAMQGLVLSQVRLSVILSSFILTCSQHQQPSLLPSSVMAHNLPCLDSLANQVNGVPSNIFQRFQLNIQVSNMEMADEVEMSSNANSQEEMEAPSNPAYRQYLADRADEERKEATMPTSMMAHCILPTNEQQQQMLLYQQLGMVQQQQQHQQLEQQHQLVQQLGGNALLSRQPDLVPVLSSLHLV